ncbi:MAG: TraR/DksA C4-type zinc finger protein [Caulobacter sp.]|nr:TraR/DksA C4-type zinc finger protein [Caulobacter sp.]
MDDQDLSPEELARYRAGLTARLADLADLETITEANRQPVELDQQSVGRLSRMDALQQQAMAMAAQQRRRNELVKVQAALKRLDDDDFGLCAACGELIPRKRLDIDATIAVCVACAGDR